jgi:3-deoxy-manno-octulosonate cytidylyltransferase (CMP-KDO synthetase)
MKYTIIIPSRYESSRLPGKPLQLIGDKPMVIQVALEAQKTNARVVVATDHIEIANICKQYNIEHCMTRDDHLAGTDRVSEAAQLIGLADDDIAINVQGDEPFMQWQIMQEVAQSLQNNPQLQMSTAAHNLLEIEKVTSPAVVKVVLNKFNQAMYFSRAPIPWHREGWGTAGTLLAAEHNPEAAAGNILKHLGIYGFRVGFLKKYSNLEQAKLEHLESLEQLRALHNGICIHVVTTQFIPLMGGIDNPADLEQARLKWQYK